MSDYIEIDMESECKNDSTSDSDDDKKKKPAKKSIKKKEQNVKKGPGRPRKNPKKDIIERKGIFKTPTDDDNVIEILYDMPLIIKKVIGFFKSMAASQIQILFRKDEIIMFSHDHHKKSKIRIRIDASKLNLYYCKNSLDIGCNFKDLESIMNKVDKDYISLAIISNKNMIQKNIKLIFQNHIQIDETHTIDLIGQYDHMINESEFLDENYMINFEWPGKYLKKTINDIKSMSTQVSLRQDNKNAPLEILYNSLNKKIHSKHIVTNNEKIKFNSRLDDGDNFRIDIKVDYIRPISTAHISDDIMIFADENKKFMTKAYIDNKTIEIKTLTEIIDDRVK